jgi:hypothetical protein
MLLRRGIFGNHRALHRLPEALLMSTRLESLLSVGGLILLSACGGRSTSNYGCGFATVAGQSLLLEEFTRPGTTLSTLPADIPGVLPVRVALGPSFRAVAGRADSLLVVGIEGTLPATPVVGWGVLIVSPSGTPQGVLLYEGSPMQGAPRLGTVNAGATNLPLIGLQTDIARFQDAACPIFPDSLRR